MSNGVSVAIEKTKKEKKYSFLERRMKPSYDIIVCAMAKISYVEEPIRHFECPGKRVVDLRPCGVPFVPTLSVSKPPTARNAPANLHVHPGCIEIVYCVRGANFFFETPGKNYPFLPGMVFVSRDDEPHRLSSNPNGHFVYRILVSKPTKGKWFMGLSRDQSEYLLTALLSLPRLFRAEDDNIRIVFERLFASYDDDSFSQARRSLALLTGVYDLLQCVIGASERTVAAPVDTVLSKFVARIESNPEHDYDFALMSREARMSPSVFAKRFATRVGMTPKAYRNACRIRKACHLLDAGRAMTDVALELGFCSASYFTAVFKRETGETPAERVSRTRTRLIQNNEEFKE